MIKTALSKAAATAEAVGELATQLQGAEASVVLVFYSSRHDAREIARLARSAWPEAHTIGCSTSGEIVSGEMTDGAIVAMAIDRRVAAEVAVAVVGDMSNPRRVDAACQQLGALLHGDLGQHVGIVLMDGLSGKEEAVMDRLGDLTDLRFIGGSSGDDLAFSATSLIADGEALSNAAVLAVLHVPAGYRVIKTQSFCRAGKQLTPTRVDAAKREVIEFDGKPASEAYCEAVGARTVEEAGSRFMSNPVGLMDGDEPYVRSPQAFDGHALKFYCAVSEGIELDLLQSTDILADTQRALAEANSDGRVIGILNFNCILRTLELKAQNKTEEYAKLFSLPTAGFSTYGEADIGHINQTATMIAFLGVDAGAEPA
ncbi:MAG: FIST N-terminal domain-containing protein [Candidatus Accumulibacter sp.]|uniref:FIST signal transduction protein n=1 Tax=Accumulibacter sp. TaxID=2053492 RepID=UPI0028798FEC|nr:FIST N-terminal domain-containing protein [Accumulibacter sp.]MDS4015626.1 FIST N-terminal domain-containing protein [Accumulibacter sp.]